MNPQKLEFLCSQMSVSFLLVPSLLLHLKKYIKLQIKCMCKDSEIQTPIKSTQGFDIAFSDWSKFNLLLEILIE